RSASYEPRADLHHAPGIPGRNQLGVRCVDVRELPVEHDVRRFWLDEVIDPGAAAAHLRLVQWNELEARNCAKHGERRIRQPLCVQQMTGRVVGDAYIDRPAAL